MKKENINRICYGLGGFSGGRLFCPVSILFLIHLYIDLQIGVKTISILVVFGFILEILTLGITGVYFDNFKIKSKNVMIFGALLMAILAEIMFHLPLFNNELIFLVVSFIVFGLFSISIGLIYNAYYKLGLKIFSNQKNSFGYVFFRLIANILFLLLLIESGILQNKNYFDIIIFCLLVAVLFPAFFVIEKEVLTVSSNNYDKRLGLLSPFKIKLSRSYMVLQVLRYISLALAIVELIIISIFNFSSLVSYSIILRIIISFFVFTFFWWFFAKSFSLKKGLVLSASAVIIMAVLVPNLTVNSSILGNLVLVLWSFGFSGLCFLTDSSSIDAVNIFNLAWKKEHHEGLFSSLTLIIAKFSFVIGILISIYIISLTVDLSALLQGKMNIEVLIYLSLVLIIIMGFVIYNAFRYPLKGRILKKYFKFLENNKKGIVNPLIDAELIKVLAKDPDFQKKPALWLYFVAGLYVGIKTRLKFNLKVKRCKIEKPALILSNHSSNHDYKFIETAVWPKRINFLSTYYWFTFKKLRPWLRYIGAIPKLQFATDINAMRKIRYVLKKNKGIIYIAPEGTVYANGHLCYISPAIVKIIENLKVNVYSATIKGAGLGCGKWQKINSKGLVEMEMKPLFKAEELDDYTKVEIYQKLVAALTYDDFEFQKERGFKIKGNHKAEGIDDLLFVCPKCGEEFYLKAEGNDIWCNKCDFKTTIDDNFRFIYDAENQGKPWAFENYILWYDWQLEKYLKIINKGHYSFTDKVDYYVDIKENDGYVKAGSGVIMVDDSGWTYSGSFKGESLIEKDSKEEVPVAIMKMGQHIELPYRNGHSRCFHFTENGKYSIKWHVISRAISESLIEIEQKRG